MPNNIWRRESDILSLLLEKAKEINNNIVWSPGLPHTDIGLTVPLKEFSVAYTISTYLYYLDTPEGMLSIYNNTEFKQALATSLNKSLSEIEDMMVDDFKRTFYPLIPYPALPSYGMVRMWWTSSSVSIPSGLYFLDVNNNRYNSLVEGSIPASLDSEVNLYYTDIPVISDKTGVDTNIESNRIVEYGGGSLTNFVRLENNEPFYGGRDEESIEDFLNRMRSWGLLKSLGVNLVIEQILKNGGALEVKLRTNRDEGYIKGYGIDAWVKLPYILIEKEYTSPEEMLQPVIEAGDGDSFSPVEYPYSPENNYYSYSIYQEPPDGMSGTSPITYKYHPLIRGLQGYLWELGNWIISSFDSVLVRLALRKRVWFDSLVIKRYITYDSSSLIDNIKDRLFSFFDGLGIGETVQVSDVIREITNVEGVDSIESLTIKGEDFSYTQADIGNDLPIEYWEYWWFDKDNSVIEVSNA